MVEASLGPLKLEKGAFSATRAEKLRKQAVLSQFLELVLSRELALLLPAAVRLAAVSHSTPIGKHLHHLEV